MRFRSRKFFLILAPLVSIAVVAVGTYAYIAYLKQIRKPNNKNNNIKKTFISKKNTPNNPKVFPRINVKTFSNYLSFDEENLPFIKESIVPDFIKYVVRNVKQFKGAIDFDYKLQKDDFGRLIEILLLFNYLNEQNQIVDQSAYRIYIS
ncbi:MHO_1590 family protein [Mycoplasma corogypsi]|uniref:MHO_1590 family protein n=1 Tax=Mycoplasma corogypsi TaxID=2106 RepID=UPI003873C2F3